MHINYNILAIYGIDNHNLFGAYVVSQVLASGHAHNY